MNLNTIYIAEFSLIITFLKRIIASKIYYNNDLLEKKKDFDIILELIVLDF